MKIFVFAREKREKARKKHFKDSLNFSRPFPFFAGINL